MKREGKDWRNFGPSFKIPRQFFKSNFFKKEENKGGGNSSL